MTQPPILVALDTPTADRALELGSALARPAEFEPAAHRLGTRQSEERAKWTEAGRRGQVGVTRALTTRSLEVSLGWTRT